MWGVVSESGGSELTTLLFCRLQDKALLLVVRGLWNSGYSEILGRAALMESAEGLLGRMEDEKLKDARAFQRSKQAGFELVGVSNGDSL